MTDVVESPSVIVRASLAGIGFFARAGALALLLLMLVVVADVAGKIIFDMPLTGALEIVSSYLMVACIFFGIAFIQLKKEHIAVDFFTQSLKKKTRDWLDAVAYGVSCAVYILLFAAVCRHAVIQTMLGEYLDTTLFELPVWPVRWMAAASFGLASIAALMQLWMYLAGKRVIDSHDSLAADERPQASV